MFNTCISCRLIDYNSCIAPTWNDKLLKPILCGFDMMQMLCLQENND